jgi:putative transposase
MRFTFIDAAKAEFPIQRLCQVLEVSQSGYFAWRSRPVCQRQRDDLVLLAHVGSAFRESKGTYGSPRMTRELQDQGLPIGRRRTARLMRRYGMRALTRRRFRPTTTDSRRALPIAPSLLQQEFAVSEPNQVWLADITYIPTGEGWLYLAAVLDLATRKVVGWAMRDHLRTELALAALIMASQRQRPRPGLIHHSDSQ